MLEEAARFSRHRYPITDSVSHAVAKIVKSIAAPIPHQGGIGQLQIIPAVLDREDLLEFETVLYLAHTYLSRRVSSKIWRVTADDRDDNRDVQDALDAGNHHLILIENARELPLLIDRIEVASKRPLPWLRYRPIAIFAEEHECVLRESGLLRIGKYFTAEAYRTRPLAERSNKELVMIFNFGLEKGWQELGNRVGPEDFPNRLKAPTIHEKLVATDVRQLIVKPDTTITAFLKLAKLTAWSLAANCNNARKRVRVPDLQPQHLLQAHTAVETVMLREALYSVEARRDSQPGSPITRATATSSSVPPPA